MQQENIPSLPSSLSLSHDLSRSNTLVDSESTSKYVKNAKSEWHIAIQIPVSEPFKKRLTKKSKRILGLRKFIHLQPPLRIILIGVGSQIDLALLSANLTYCMHSLKSYIHHIFMRLYNRNLHTATINIHKEVVIT